MCHLTAEPQGRPGPTEVVTRDVPTVELDERFNPTRILDATGAVFAREGDLVRVTYILEGTGESACSLGTPVAAETVERVAASPEPIVP